MKKTLLFCCLAIISQISIAQEIKISGVVTYFFNQNFGDKPDIGSTVFVFNDSQQPYLVNKNNGDTTKLPKTFKGTLDTFNIAVTYRAIYANYKLIESKRNPVPQDIIDKLKQFNVETDEKFSALDKRTTKICFVIEYSANNIQNAAVDGNGNFTVKPKQEGKYYVFVRSSHQKGSNLSNVLGKFDCEEVEITGNEEKSIAINFRP